MKEFKYSEREIIDNLVAYISSTYNQHYRSEKIQLIDLFESEGIVVEYLKTSIMKYVLRYGKKDGMNVKDLMKAMHCIVLLIHFTSFSKSQFPPTPAPQILEG